MVADLIKPDKIKQLYKKYPIAIEVAPHAEEETGRNALPRAIAAAFDDAGFKVDKNIVQANKVARTKKNEALRLAIRPEFDGEIESGQQYILIDDAIGQGGTASELRFYIEANGGEVVGLCALTSGRNSTTLNLSDQTARKVIDQYGYQETNKLLQEFGVAGDLYELTENEARYLAKYKTLDAFRNRILKEGYEGLSPETQRALFPPETYGLKTNEQEKVFFQQELYTNTTEALNAGEAIEHTAESNFSRTGRGSLGPPAKAEAAAQAAILYTRKLPEQSIVTVKDAQDFLESHGYPRITESGQIARTLSQLPSDENFQNLNIFDQIRVAAQVERPLRQKDYITRAIPATNKKNQGTLGEIGAAFFFG